MISLSESDHPAPSFAHELSKRVSVFEIGFLLAVPVVLVLVFLLSDAVRESLVFRTSAPTLLSAFAAHYLHLSESHLVNNLIIYFGAVGFGYPLAVLGGLRREYLSLVLAILLGFPFVLSTLHLVLLGTGNLVGFSGLALGLVGLLPIVLFVYLKSRIEGTVLTNDSPALFFLGIAVIAWRTDAPNALIQPILIVSTAIAVFYLLPLMYRLARIGRITGPRPFRRGYVELPVAVVILFFLALAVGFPTNPIENAGPTTNLLIHLAAYSLAFVGGYVTNRTLRVMALPPPPPPPPPPPSRD